MTTRSNYFESTKNRLLTWKKSHTKLYSYNSKIKYKSGDIVSIGSALFRSTVNNNSSDPLTLINWIRIL